jgi:hypothetical protein
MTINEAKMIIAKEFITKYLEWLNDHNNPEMSDRDYGRKYGWGKCNSEMKDTQKSMLWFQSHVFSGRHVWAWKEVGIDKAMVYELYRNDFLSYDYCTSHKARVMGKADFFYICQNKAKEIYKAYKNGFFAKA